LKDRKIILFPDLGAYNSWQLRATEIQKTISCQITVSDLLEQRANKTDKANGLDLADYLITQDSALEWALTEHHYPVFWDDPLK
jgi:hypothetical protein